MLAELAIEHGGPAAIALAAERLDARQADHADLARRWQNSSTKCAAFIALSENMMPLLATMPATMPCRCAKPVASVVPQRAAAVDEPARADGLPADDPGG